MNPEFSQRHLFNGFLGWHNNSVEYLKISNTSTAIALKTGQIALPQSIKKPIRINMSKHITESGR